LQHSHVPFVRHRVHLRAHDPEAHKPTLGCFLQHRDLSNKVGADDEVRIVKPRRG
jgi:hypothetical protein